MPDNNLWSDNFYCSFCHKPSAEVGKLIAGSGVHICDRCVGLCRTILDDEAASTSVEPRLPLWESMSDDQILDHLPGVVMVQTRVDENLREWIGRLRARDVSWERIGASLSVTSYA